MEKTKKGLSKKVKILLSVIALFEIVALLSLTTYGWIISSTEVKVTQTSSDIIIEPSADLTIKYGDSYSGKINLNTLYPDVVFSECSSVDGRNMFFPISYKGDDQTTGDVYFKNTSNWSKVYAYCFDSTKSSGSEYYVAWPGEPMTSLGNSIYTYEVPEGYDKVVFNIGAQNSEGNQTANLDFKRGMLYDYSKNDWETFSNTTTNELRFRKGTAQDVNKKYLSVDFTLSSTSGETDVYFDSTSFIDGDAAGAVRFSINKNDGSDPIVFDNSSLGYDQISYQAVSSIVSTGVATTTAQIPKAIQNHIYSGDNSPIFTIPSNGTVTITLTVWLEGTDADFTDAIANKDFRLYLKFSTTKEDVRVINFIDKTIDSFVEDTVAGYSVPPHMFAKYFVNVEVEDPSGNPQIVQREIKYKMIKSATYANDKTWYAEIPAAVTEVEFQRNHPTEDITWNYWAAGTIPTGVDTYYAFGGHPTIAEGEGPCIGYWQAAIPTRTVYLTVKYQDYWTSGVSCYAFGLNYNNNNFANRISMGWVKNNGQNQPVFACKIPVCADRLVFANGNGSGENQTVDITGVLSDYNNGIDSYYLDAKQSDNKWSVGKYTYADNVTIYFSNAQNWSGDIYCHHWKNNNPAWPGDKMTYIKNNDFGQAIYAIDVPAGSSVVFNNNGSSQTPDITSVTDGTGYYVDGSGNVQTFDM